MNDNAALALFEQRLSALAASERRHQGRSAMWLAHHWPDQYHERCARVGGRWVCRRCAALYPIGIFSAVVFALGIELWPRSWDPLMIWLLCLPATIAYCAEAFGLIRYNPRIQVLAMLVTATAFGRALGYEFVSRWSPEFWGPVAVFGGLWFFATLNGRRLGRSRPTSGQLS